ncbi:glycosyltransferase family 4 protein [Alicyclobacillus fastidiosus]|uniref:Glycosyltransferase family 4 protein n=1 Tax=Alicyclobacillus fastidiosus TaxID=392011 RepID=A0ABY6ZCF0_9BACL|nr:glycosyltransferase family 4 protein [Alicyclobacillus fastidiosus]WAH39791.1 glycosyltransferase family 4 protein [Alicyclobacillus fastidiosus]
MRILLIIHRLLQGGGTETHVMNLANQLRRRGHQVGIFTSGGLWAKKARELGIKVHQQKFTSKQLSQVILRNNYSVIHAHDTRSLRLIEHTEIPSKTHAFLTIHGMYIDGPLIRRCLNKTSRVIVVSPALQTYVAHVGVSSSKVTLIKNGISMTDFKGTTNKRLRARYRIPDNVKVIGYAGRFTLQKRLLGKRVVKILEGISRSRRDVWVLVAGRGSQLSVKNSVRCRVLGHVDDMQTFYNSCDIVIGSGRTAIEALACGVPTIAVGTKGYIGPVLRSTWLKAVKCNFGDHVLNRMKWTNEKLRNDTHNLLHRSNRVNSELKIIYRRVRLQYSDITKVKEVEQMYSNWLRPRPVYRRGSQFPR